MTRRKKAAMEMSVGTIVTIVLLVSVLILGIFLVQKIFKSATSVVDLTDQQLTEEVNKLFSSSDNKVVIYPNTREIIVKQSERGGIGIGIKNLLEGVSGTQKFSYEVVLEAKNQCVESEEQIMNWIQSGRSGTGLTIPVGDLASRKVLIQVPVGSSLCTARFGVNIFTEDGQAYANDFFDVTVTAK